MEGKGEERRLFGSASGNHPWVYEVIELWPGKMRTSAFTPFEKSFILTVHKCDISLVALHPNTFSATACKPPRAIGHDGFPYCSEHVVL